MTSDPMSPAPSAIRANPMGIEEVKAPEVVYASTGSMVWAALKKGNLLSSAAPIEPASRFRRFAHQSGAWARAATVTAILAGCILLPLIFAGA